MALIDRIKYDGPPPKPNGDQTPWIVYKFPSQELVLGSQLIVNQSQEAIFYKGGSVCDVFGPGRHTLTSANLPLLTKLEGLPFGGKSPFAAEVYFVNKVSKLDMKWGTPEPFLVTEPQYKIIVKVRAFGQFGMRISESKNFVTQIVGALQDSQISDYSAVSSYFKGLVTTKVEDTIADIIKKGLSVMDITASIDKISTECRNRVTDIFAGFGIDVLNFFIESINVPAEDLAKLKQALESRAEFDILGDERYARKRSFDVLEKAASNEGGGGTMGAGLGMGMGLGAGMSAGKLMGNITGQMNVTPPETKGTLTIKCGKCNAENQPDARYCYKCGKELSQDAKICPKCNSANLNDANFCSKCGNKITD